MRVCVVLRVLDCVFAFLQLRDVQLGFAAVQPLEPHLVVVDGGDDGAARHRHTTTSGELLIFGQNRHGGVRWIVGFALPRSLRRNLVPPLRIDVKKRLEFNN